MPDPGVGWGGECETDKHLEIREGSKCMYRTISEGSKRHSNGLVLCKKLRVRSALQFSVLVEIVPTMLMSCLSCG